jgi:hypothetical protein
MFVSVLIQDLYYQCNTSIKLWSFRVQAFEMRGGVSFCWYWWNYWLSLSFYNAFNSMEKFNKGKLHIINLTLLLGFKVMCVTSWFIKFHPSDTTFVPFSPWKSDCIPSLKLSLILPEIYNYISIWSNKYINWYKQY